MMNQWKKKVSGAMIASLLALTLNSKAYAAPEDAAVPAEPLTVIEEEALNPIIADSSVQTSAVPNMADPAESQNIPAGTDSSPSIETTAAPADANIPNPESTDNIPKGNSTEGVIFSAPENGSGSSETGSENPAGDGEAVSGDNAETKNDVSITATASGSESVGNNAAIDTDKEAAGDGKLTGFGSSESLIVEGEEDALSKGGAVHNANSADNSDTESFSGTGEIPSSEQTRSEDDIGSSENNSSEAPGTISLGSTTFTPGQDESIDLSSTTASEDDCFGFDAGTTDAASDDCFYMVDYDGSSQSLISSGSDINIKAAGLNLLGSIQADGDVNITGTGILLLDSISISEEHGFFLHPIAGMYESGSVAVFLRMDPTAGTDVSSGSDSSNTVYQLINGNVPGILDENYTLPDNVSLIVPENSSLILQSTVQETIRAHEEDGEAVPESVTVYTTKPDYIYDSNHSYEYSAPNLTIPASSGLTLESGASLISNSIIAQFGQIYKPLITVNGSLNGAGIIKNTYVLFNSTSAGSTAAFQNSRIINHSQNISLTIYDSCSLLSADGTSIGTIDLMPGSELYCYADPASSGCSVTLNDGISGSGSIMFEAGDYYICNENFTCTSSVTISTDGSHVTINDISGTLAALEIKGASIAVDPDDAVMPGPNAIPVVTAEISTVYWSVMGYTTWGGSTVSTATLDPDLVSEDGSLSFQALAEEYSAGFNDNQSSAKYLIQVYTINNGKLISHLIDIDEEGNYTEGSVPADQVWLIRLLYISATTNQGSGGSVMSTNTSITGSGILGGPGAGSMTGGAGTQIDLSSFNTGNNQGNGNGDSENGNGQSNDTGDSENGNGLSNDNGDSENGNGQSNDNGGSQNNSNTGISDTTAGDQVADNQPNDNSGNHVNSDPAAEETYITPEDIKPDVKPEDLVITVTEQKTGISSAEPNRPATGQTASTQRAETVSLEEVAPVYTLTVTVDNQQVTKLNEKITVRFSCPAPKTNRQIFAVFRDKDGSLKAFKARYDKIQKQLVFETDMLGDFAVVCIDFNGELYSEDFYKYLETFDSVKTLN